MGRRAGAVASKALTPFRVLLGALMIFGALWGWTRLADQPERETALRQPPTLPQPSTQDRVLFFFDMVKRSATTEVGGKMVRDWHVIAERALRELGTPTFDHILAKDRYAEYGRSPTLVSNVFRFIGDSPAVRDHPLFPQFVQDWLDPKQHPKPRPGNNWTPGWKRELFRIIARYPRVENVALCLAELNDPAPDPDMRGFALDVLLYLGADVELSQVWQKLPRDEEDQDYPLRSRLLAYLLEFSEPGQDSKRKDTVEAMRAFLHDARGSALALERMRAEAILRRLGDPSAEPALLAEHKRLTSENESLAWNVLRLLNADAPHPYVKEVALTYATQPDKPFSYFWALRLLARWWLDDPQVVALAWEAVREHADQANPLVVLHELQRVDRPAVIEHLITAVKSGDNERIHAAVRFAMKNKMTEIGPAIFDALAGATARQRPYYFRALTELRMPRVIPLLKAELKSSRPNEVRNLAVSELLTLDAGLSEVADRLRAGDNEAFDALHRRAQAGGRDGVPDALVDALLESLDTLTGEDAKLRALFILRCRGTLEGVRDGLLNAYRKEPSRRVARAIREALIELSHR